MIDLERARCGLGKVEPCFHHNGMCSEREVSRQGRKVKWSRCKLKTANVVRHILDFDL